jgi:hypothetical protein
MPNGGLTQGSPYAVWRRFHTPDAGVSWSTGESNLLLSRSWLVGRTVNPPSARGGGKECVRVSWAIKW